MGEAGRQGKWEGQAGKVGGAGRESERGRKRRRDLRKRAVVHREGRKRKALVKSVASQRHLRNPTPCQLLHSRTYVHTYILGTVTHNVPNMYQVGFYLPDMVKVKYDILHVR